jgi:toxin-antitoxin system PIN domain toxin
MLLADSNVWLALALSKHALHPAVRTWFVRQRPTQPVLFCRTTQQSFLRLLTTSAVLAPYGIPPLSNKAAWSAFEGFRVDRRIGWADEPRALETHWKRLASGAKPSPKLWMDAYLAAFALAAGYQIVTTDKAFKQFKGLDVVVLSRS